MISSEPPLVLGDQRIEQLQGLRGARKEQHKRIVVAGAERVEVGPAEDAAAVLSHPGEQAQRQRRTGPGDHDRVRLQGVRGERVLGTQPDAAVGHRAPQDGDHLVSRLSVPAPDAQRDAAPEGGRVTGPERAGSVVHDLAEQRGPHPVLSRLPGGPGPHPPGVVRHRMAGTVLPLDVADQVEQAVAGVVPSAAQAGRLRAVPHGQQP